MKKDDLRRALENWERCKEQNRILADALREIDALMRECYLGPVCNDERWIDGGERRIMAAQEAMRAALAKVSP